MSSGVSFRAYCPNSGQDHRGVGTACGCCHPPQPVQYGWRIHTKMALTHETSTMRESYRAMEFVGE